MTLSSTSSTPSNNISTDSSQCVRQMMDEDKFDHPSPESDQSEEEQCVSLVGEPGYSLG